MSSLTNIFSKTRQLGRSLALSSAGQSLIEVLVVLAVAIIVMVALVIVILTGLKNSEIAQNQIKATKYAQDALEQMTALRDRNSNIKINGISPDPQFSYLFGSSLSAPPCTTVNAKVVCYFILDTSQDPSLQQIADPFRFNQDLGDSGLSRQIFFEDGLDDNEKKVTVRVMWTDSSGLHESNLQTYLTKH